MIHIFLCGNGPIRGKLSGSVTVNPVIRIVEPNQVPQSGFTGDPFLALWSIGNRTPNICFRLFKRRILRGPGEVRLFLVRAQIQSLQTEPDHSPWLLQQMDAIFKTHTTFKPCQITLYFHIRPNALHRTLRPSIRPDLWFRKISWIMTRWNPSINHSNRKAGDNLSIRDPTGIRIPESISRTAISDSVDFQPSLDTYQHQRISG